MKTIYYLFIIVLLFGLSSSAFIHTEKEKENAKEQHRLDSVRISNMKKRTGTDQPTWLYKTKFPNLQPSPCPFYVVKPGC